MKQIPVLIVLTLSLSLCNLTQKLTGSKNDNANSNNATANSNSSGTGSAPQSGLPPADRPEPTAAQTAALAGGQSVNWDQQGLTWMLPAKWTKVSEESKLINWKSPGSWDAGFLITSISVMDANFPTDISLKATYDQQVSRQKNGEVSEVRWLELDGVRGVQFLETPPEGKENPRRLQWIAYRKFAGQSQMVNMILSSQGQHFDKHKDALYGILYSTKLVHE
jgi:hypothetical protein